MDRESPTISHVLDHPVEVVDPVLTTFTFTDFKTKPAQMTDAVLIDQVAELRKAKSAIEKREKLLAEALKSRNNFFEGYSGQDEIPPLMGAHYRLIPEVVVQHRLDGERLKEEFGEAWYEDHCKVITFVQMRVAAVDDAKQE